MLVSFEVSDLAFEQPCHSRFGNQDSEKRQGGEEELFVD